MTEDLFEMHREKMLTEREKQFALHYEQSKQISFFLNKCAGYLASLMDKFSENSDNLNLDPSEQADQQEDSAERSLGMAGNDDDEYIWPDYLMQ